MFILDFHVFIYKSNRVFMHISCMARNKIALELNTMNSVGFIDTIVSLNELV